MRAMVYYPMSNGCSIDGICRLVQALQAPDAHNIATPENRQPVWDVIVPSPQIAG